MAFCTNSHPRQFLVLVYQCKFKKRLELLTMMAEEEKFETPDDQVEKTGLIRQRGGSVPQPPKHDDMGMVVADALTPAQAFEVFAGRSYQSPPNTSTSAVAGNKNRSPAVDPVRVCLSSFCFGTCLVE
jgi:hypothetical protein